MERYLYVTAVPEALVVSMLAPEEFGSYLAVGTKKRARGRAVFFEVDSDLKSDYFDFSQVERRCVSHPDGEPKHSLYISVYRVFENVPLDAFGDLLLATRDGKVLRLSHSAYEPVRKEELYLYKEMGPVYPTIASKLGPTEFVKFITDRSRPISVPKIFFADLELGSLAEETEPWGRSNLPYHDVAHIRDCLIELRHSNDKQTKTVDRISTFDFFYRTIKEGFFLGERDRLLWYRFPSKAELDRAHHDWWRSASLH
jgi:hypothetical protein